MTAKGKRRQYPVLFKSRQYRLLAMIMVYSFSICAVLFGFLFVPDILQMLDHTASPEMRGFAADRILMLHARLWPVVLAIICLIGIHSFRLFSLVVGPLVGLRRALEKLEGGDLTARVAFRKGDFLIEEGDLFNAAVASLADGTAGVNVAAGGAERSLQRMRQKVDSLPADAAAQVTGAMDDLANRFEDLQRAAGFFITDPADDRLQDRGAPTA